MNIGGFLLALPAIVDDANMRGSPLSQRGARGDLPTRAHAPPLEKSDEAPTLRYPSIPLWKRGRALAQAFPLLSSAFKRSAFLLCLVLLAIPCRAAGLPRPFDATTPAALAQRYAGKPYILAFWSLECSHCQAELSSFARQIKANPALPLVLVATDAPELAPAVAARLAEIGLDPASQWSFADTMPERVRFAVDRRWRGELPRTYFFDAAHRSRAVAGMVGEALLATWMTENLK